MLIRIPNMMLEDSELYHCKFGKTIVIKHDDEHFRIGLESLGTQLVLKDYVCELVVEGQRKVCRMGYIKHDRKALRAAPSIGDFDLGDA